MTNENEKKDNNTRQACITVMLPVIDRLKRQRCLSLQIQSPSGYSPYPRGALAERLAKLQENDEIDCWQKDYLSALKMHYRLLPTLNRSTIVTVNTLISLTENFNFVSKRVIGLFSIHTDKKEGMQRRGATVRPVTKEFRSLRFSKWTDRSATGIVQNLYPGADQFRDNSVRMDTLKYFVRTDKPKYSPIIIRQYKQFTIIHKLQKWEFGSSTSNNVIRHNHQYYHRISYVDMRSRSAAQNIEKRLSFQTLNHTAANYSEMNIRVLEYGQGAGYKQTNMPGQKRTGYALGKVLNHKSYLQTTNMDQYTEMIPRYLHTRPISQSNELRKTASEQAMPVLKSPKVAKIESRESFLQEHVTKEVTEHLDKLVREELQRQRVPGSVGLQRLTDRISRDLGAQIVFERERIHGV